MAKNGLGMIVIVALVIGVGALFLGLIPGISSPLAVTPSPPSAAQIPITDCQSNTTPELNLKPFDSVNKATSRASDVNVILFINGFFNENHSAATNFSNIAPGDDWVAYVVGTSNNTTDFARVISSGTVDPTTGAQYGRIACQEVQTINFFVDNIGNTTDSYFNATTDAANSISATQSLGLGETASIRASIQATDADECWGVVSDLTAPPLLLVFDYNSADISNINVTGTSASDAPLPLGHGSTDANRNTFKAITLNEIQGICDFETADFRISLSFKESGETTIADEVGVNIYAPQLIANTNTGEYQWMYRNNVTSAAIVSPQTSTIYYSGSA